VNPGTDRYAKALPTGESPLALSGVALPPRCACNPKTFQPRGSVGLDRQGSVGRKSDKYGRRTAREFASPEVGTPGCSISAKGLRDV
jgi:hypothetical protein